MSGAALLAALFCGCTEEPIEDPPDAPTPTEPTITTVQLPCPVAGNKGLAVRTWTPGEDHRRWGTAAPVFLRLGGLGSVGFQIQVDAEIAAQKGAVVVQFIGPGQAGSEASSGGTNDFFGKNYRAALQCVFEYLEGTRVDDEGSAFPADAEVVIATGLSLSGGSLVTSVASGTTPADGVVLWESPMVDQIITSELSPGGTLDPLFVPGTCTLDKGCPIPDRAALLQIDGEELVLFQDLDQNGMHSNDEPQYLGVEDTWTGTSRRYFSMELQAEASALIGDPPPYWWVEAKRTQTFWAARDATEALIQIRDEGSSIPFIFVASAMDHVQPHHEHVRLAQEGLLGSVFFRLNADNSYTKTIKELPAGECIDDPDDFTELPNGLFTTMVLAAELELADRLWADNWEPDLDEPLFLPVN